MQCSCEISSCDADDTYYDCDYQVRLKISGSIKCGECQKEIGIGEKYEHATCYLSDDGDSEVDTHITCLDCKSLRDNFFGDWVFSGLWEDFFYHVENCDGNLPEDCISKLTPVAREKVCNVIEEVWETMNQ